MLKAAKAKAFLSPHARRHRISTSLSWECPRSRHFLTDDDDDVCHFELLRAGARFTLLPLQICHLHQHRLLYHNKLRRYVYVYVWKWKRERIDLRLFCFISRGFFFCTFARKVKNTFVASISRPLTKRCVPVFLTHDIVMTTTTSTYFSQKHVI